MPILAPASSTYGFEHLERDGRRSRSWRSCSRWIQSSCSSSSATAAAVEVLTELLGLDPVEDLAELELDPVEDLAELS